MYVRGQRPRAFFYRLPSGNENRCPRGDGVYIAISQHSTLEQDNIN